MSRKRITALVAALSLVTVVGIGATLAYYTDQAEAVNTVGMGRIAIQLTENQVKQDENGNWVIDESQPVTDEGLTFYNVYPGETVEKNPTVRLEERSGNAYIRMKMEIDKANSTLTDKDIQALQNRIDREIAEAGEWTKSSDGYYYYNEILNPEDEAVFFETVTLPGEEWGNNTAGQTFHIKLYAEAIQSDHFTPQGEDGKITGWLDGNGQPIAVETAAGN